MALSITCLFSIDEDIYLAISADQEVLTVFHFSS
jgi:hypothetical protein